MDPSQLPAYLEGIAARAASAAVPAVDAMAASYQDRVANVTLRLYQHAPETWTNSPPGQPPAHVTGELAGSVRATPGVLVAFAVAGASVAPHTVYAEIQETGGTIHAHFRTRGGYTGTLRQALHEGSGYHTMHFRVAGRDFFPMEVTLPARPYMEPTTLEMVASGALRDDAAAAFLVAVWG